MFSNERTVSNVRFKIHTIILWHFKIVLLLVNMKKYSGKKKKTNASIQLLNIIVIEVIIKHCKLFLWDRFIGKSITFYG